MRSLQPREGGIQSPKRSLPVGRVAHSRIHQETLRLPGCRPGGERTGPTPGRHSPCDAQVGVDSCTRLLGVVLFRTAGGSVSPGRGQA